MDNKREPNNVWTYDQDKAVLKFIRYNGFWMNRITTGMVVGLAKKLNLKPTAVKMRVLNVRTTITNVSWNGDKVVPIKKLNEHLARYFREWAAIAE